MQAWSPQQDILLNVILMEQDIKIKKQKHMKIRQKKKKKYNLFARLFCELPMIYWIASNKKRALLKERWRS